MLVWGSVLLNTFSLCWKISATSLSPSCPSDEIPFSLHRQSLHTPVSCHTQSRNSPSSLPTPQLSPSCWLLTPYCLYLFSCLSPPDREQLEGTVAGAVQALSGKGVVWREHEGRFVHHACVCMSLCVSRRFPGTFGFFRKPKHFRTSRLFHAPSLRIKLHKSLIYLKTGKGKPCRDKK